MAKAMLSILTAFFVLIFANGAIGSTDAFSTADSIEPVVWGSYGGKHGKLPGEFHNPRGLAVDSNGNLYVADISNYRIQVFNDRGIFLRQWRIEGMGDSLALDAEGYLYVPVRTGSVVKFDLDGNEVLRWGKRGRGPGEFQSPSKITINRKSKRIYIQDVNKGDVQTFNYTGQFLERWDCWDKISPNGIALDSTGNLLVIDSNKKCIFKLSDTGVQLQVLQYEGMNGGDSIFPGEIAIGPKDEIYISDLKTHKIHKLDSSGSLLKSWGKLGSDDGNFCNPHGIAFFQDHTLYISDSRRNHRIQKFTSDGDFVWKIGKTPPSCEFFTWPAHIFASDENHLYVTDSGYVKQFDADGNIIRCWGELGDSEGQLKAPKGIAVYETKVFVVDQGNNKVQVFDETGLALNSWGSKGHADGEFINPTEISIDQHGSVFILDRGNLRVQQFNTDGDFINKFKAINSPSGMAIDSQGGIYITSRKYHTVRKYDTEGNILLEWGGEGIREGEFSHPVGICIGEDNTVFVVDFENSRIQRFDNQGVFISQYGTLGFDVGDFRRPQGVACWGGFVFVADSNNMRIQRFPAKYWARSFSRAQNKN
ncbi:MAG: 6-bladed beta-propeller [bacterium]|nr:6-bladed beta-propeller [bacterium]